MDVVNETRELNDRGASEDLRQALHLPHNCRRVSDFVRCRLSRGKKLHDQENEGEAEFFSIQLPEMLELCFRTSM